jgi:hypothetical protein
MLSFWVIGAVLHFAIADIIQTVDLPTYKYQATAIVPESYGSSYVINSPFSIQFQEASFVKFYLNNNGYITFDAPTLDLSLPEFIHSPKLLIGPTHSTLSRVEVFKTADNLTVHYQGKLDGRQTGEVTSYFISSGVIEWYLTFYNSANQNYTIDIKTGNCTAKVCTQLNCYL